MKLLEPLKISNLTMPNRIFLAPMVDVTDVAYRELCRKYGAGMVYTEMIYIDAILHENEKTKKLMKIDDKKPVGLQVTGNNVEEFKKFAKLEEIKKYDLIDINCGCPSTRITGNEAGSFLLKNPSKIAEMVKVLKKEGFIVTVKIRLGFEKNNALKIAKEIEEAGADLLTVHARLAIHGRSIPADWKEIKKIKKALKIPVIANGDIFSAEDVLKVVEETGCDGVMIARSAIGNPLIFREIIRYLETGKENKITKEERIECFYDYVKLTKKYSVIDIGRIKYLGANFLKDFNGAAKLRGEFMKCKTFEDVQNFLKPQDLRKMANLDGLKVR